MEFLTLFKMAASLVIFITSLLTGLGPLRVWFSKTNHHLVSIGEAFAAGIFLGAALFHMLPDADIAFQAVLGSIHYPYANLICAVGFTTLLFLEVFTMYYLKERHQNKLQIIPYILAIVLSIHALSEGIALGINNILANTIIIFTAIIVHKSSESFALAANFIRSNLSLSQMTRIILAFSLMTPLGILAGLSVLSKIPSHTGYILQGSFNAFAAGTFLYLATLHKVYHQHSHIDKKHLTEFIALMTGLSLMALLAIWV